MQWTIEYVCTQNAKWQLTFCLLIFLLGLGLRHELFEKIIFRVTHFILPEIDVLHDPDLDIILREGNLSLIRKPIILGLIPNQRITKSRFILLAVSLKSHPILSLHLVNLFKSSFFQYCSSPISDSQIQTQKSRDSCDAIGRGEEEPWLSWEAEFGDSLREP